MTKKKEIFKNIIFFPARKKLYSFIKTIFSIECEEEINLGEKKISKKKGGS